MKNNKYLIWFLGVALVAVWGTVGYRVYNGYTNIDEVNVAKTVALKKSGFNRYEYKRDVRDPFELMPSYNKKQTIIPATTGIKKEDNWYPPPYNLNGVIIDKERRIAILEGTDGTTSFVAVRDSINGVVILNIESTHVEYSFRGKKQSWRIEQ